MEKMGHPGIRHNLVLLFIIIQIIFTACQTDEKKNNAQQSVESHSQSVPSFSADSAYAYIKKQVDFGPRNLGSIGHEECAKFLIAKMKLFTDTVIVQRTSVKTYDGKVFPIQNIIGSIKPDIKNRILIAAHWDTRHVADQDSVDKDKPILGANDGASGVGIALELARLLNTVNPKWGIDFILFDAEDYGQPDDDLGPYMQDSYCLGSQYWGKNTHVPNYYARFGILLDMVGAKDAKFTLEGTSMHFAPDVIKGVWNTAAGIGYSDVFIQRVTKPITDDHYYINKLTGIPTIDIIEHSETTSSNFGHYWHTHQDNMEIIDTVTLKAVGQTVLTHVIRQMN